MDQNFILIGERHVQLEALNTKQRTPRFQCVKPRKVCEKAKFGLIEWRQKRKSDRPDESQPTFTGSILDE
jgi:hypothetical protein